MSTINPWYVYNDAIIPVGVAKPEPIIQNFLAIQRAFSMLDLESLDRLKDLLKELFPSLQDCSIFTKYWPVVVSPVSYALNMVDYGTHIIPLGYDGDLQVTFEAWPSKGTKFVTIIFINGGRGIVRWPLNVLWQTRGQVPPIMKQNGFDTVVLWRDAEIQSVLGQDVILAARAGR